MVARVLIIEDNAVTRAFLLRVVRESFTDEITCSEASDLVTGRAALATQAESGAFRLILTALELDDGRGLELLPEMHKMPAIKVATTLHSDHEHLFPALQCGADGYLLKEDRFEVLVEELQKIVRGQPPLSPAVARCMVAHFRDREAPSPSKPASTPASPERLNARESEVLNYVSKGYTIKEVARLMNTRWFAVNDHIRTVYTKLAASTGGIPSSATDEESLA
jgi:two-component system, NarL family, nitrate/nitrite response regulator NarL